MTPCNIHHTACDCREEKFKQLEAENEKLRAEQHTAGAIAQTERDNLREKLDKANETIASWKKIAEHYQRKLDKARAGLEMIRDLQPPLDWQKSEDRFDVCRTTALQTLKELE